MLEGTLNTAQSNPKLRISCLLVTLVLFDAGAQLTLGSGCGWWRPATVLLAVGLLTSVIAWCSDVLFDRRPAAVVPVPAAVDINAGRRQNMPVEGEVIGRIVAEALALRRLPADLPRQNAAAAMHHVVECQSFQRIFRHQLECQDCQCWRQPTEADQVLFYAKAHPVCTSDQTAESDLNFLNNAAYALTLYSSITSFIKKKAMLSQGNRAMPL